MKYLHLSNRARRFVDRLQIFTVGALMLAMFLALFGMVGRMDYEYARMKECAQLEKLYNHQLDVCYGPAQKN